MSRIGEPGNRPLQDVFQGQIDTSRAQQEVLRGLDGKQVCPFCGSVSEKSGLPCARCGMDNTPEARKATKARIGPWYVLQARNPAAPGMRFETLLSFVRKGRVRARSVVRGPTTHQLWRFAAHVKGLSREFGLCFSCGSPIETTANICPLCNRLQEPPLNPDVLLEDGSEEGPPAAAAVPVRPIFRELPNQATPSDALSSSEPEIQDDDDDIVIPALGDAPQTDPVAKPVMPPRPLASPPASPAPAPSGRSTAAPPPSSMTTSDEDPFAIAPARKKSTADSTFLSAKDLAAAFKLSFDPSADMDAVEVPDLMPASALPEGMRPGAIVPRNPKGLPPTPQPQRAPLVGRQAVPVRRRRAGGFRKFVLFVLILVGTGFGVLMWVDPTARQRTVQWSKWAYAELYSYLSDTGTGPSGASGDSTSSVDDMDAALPPARTAAAASTTSPTPVDGELEATETMTIASEPQQPDVAAEAQDSEESDKLAEPAPSVTPKLEKRPTSPKPAPAKSTAASPRKPEPGDPDSNAKQIARLRKAAFAAEARDEYAEAVRLYTEIMKFPRAEWPTDVELRFNLASERVKE